MHPSLSNRARKILEMLGIENDDQLCEDELTKEEVFGLPKLIGGIDEAVCVEIWNYIQRLQASQASADTHEDNRPLESPKFEVVPLGIAVSDETWKRLQETLIDQVSWTGRVQKALGQLGCQTLADVAQISPGQWFEQLKGFELTFNLFKYRLKEILDDFHRDAKQSSRSSIQDAAQHTRVEHIPAHSDTSQATSHSHVTALNFWKRLLKEPQMTESADSSETPESTDAVPIPFLRRKVPVTTWNQLQNALINRVVWSRQTERLLREQEIETLGTSHKYLPTNGFVSTIPAASLLLSWR